MLKTTSTLLGATLLSAAIALPVQAQEDTLQIGWTAWSDAEFVTRLATKVLEEEMDVTVEMTQTDIAPQYQGVAQGDIDVMMMAWLPNTHENYWDQVASDLQPLGILYTDARLGWAVPTYIPEDQLSSIEDLKNEEVKSQLGSEIQGIDPGAGLMQASEDTIETYGLDYELLSASGAGMTAALDRAVRKEEWIVVTAWNPHWMFGAYDLRYLEDPEGTLSGVESIQAMGRQDFTTDFPEVAGFYARMTIPIEDLEASMNEAQETSYEEAVQSYIDNNQARINYWVTGEIN